jgi:phosphatidate cytidylyltransferase
MLGQIGDLFASSIKRWAGVKDFGTIFPGHGGMMDRLDSVLFCAPIIFVYFYSAKI